MLERLWQFVVAEWPLLLLLCICFLLFIPIADRFSKSQGMDDS